MGRLAIFPSHTQREKRGLRKGAMTDVLDARGPGRTPRPDHPRGRASRDLMALAELRPAMREQP